LFGEVSYLFIPTFDPITGQCVSLYWQTPTNQYVLIPIRRNGDRAEANPDDPDYGYLVQQIIDDSEYLELDLSDRTPEPQPSPQPEKDYVGLWNSFLREGISIFLFVRYLADQTLPIANAYSDFKDALTSPTPTPEGLQSSVDNLFAAIRAYGTDFNQEQSAAMRSLLDSYGFSSIVFPLGV
jgi:hypothetical protein